MLARLHDRAMEGLPSPGRPCPRPTAPGPAEPRQPGRQPHPGRHHANTALFAIAAHVDEREAHIREVQRYGQTLPEGSYGRRNRQAFAARETRVADRLRAGERASRMHRAQRHDQGARAQSSLSFSWVPGRQGDGVGVDRRREPAGHRQLADPATGQGQAVAVEVQVGVDVVDDRGGTMDGADAAGRLPPTKTLRIVHARCILRYPDGASRKRRAVREYTGLASRPEDGRHLAGNAEPSGASQRDGFEQVNVVSMFKRTLHASGES